MSAAMDISGQRFGRLTAIAFAGRKGSLRTWECVCDCGNRTSVPLSALRSGNTTSCGCLRYERLRMNALKHGHTSTRSDATHRRASREYRAWGAAKERCYRPLHKDYANYGGRGIVMCDEWASDFRVFLRDMGTCPSGMTLDRVDPNGNYEPGNCRWLPMADQSRNRRCVQAVDIDGRHFPTITAAAQAYSISRTSVRDRLRAGWSIEDALRRRPTRPGPKARVLYDSKAA